MSSDRRLHPLSIVISLAGILRRLILPLLVTFFAARSQSREPVWVYGLLGVAAMASVVRYFTFRYRYDETELVIRSGILVRNERHIPYDRIQNIDSVQPPLQRLLGVVTVVVQTGSGRTAEARMSVLPLEALEEMRARVFVGRQAPSVAMADARGSEPVGAPASAPIAQHLPHQTLVHLDPSALFLAGMLENSALLAVLPIVALFRPIADLLDRFGPLHAVAASAVNSLDAGPSTPASLVVYAVGILMVFLLLRVVVAIGMVVRFFDFRASLHGEDLRVEHGLLTRVVNTIPLRRIQWVVVEDSILLRMAGRVAVRLTTAGGHAHEGEAAAQRAWLGPILQRADVPALVAAVQPGVRIDAELRGPHRNGFRRALVIPSLLLVATAAILLSTLPWPALIVPAALMIPVVVRARLLTGNLGWTADDRGIVFRGGAFRRHTASARFSRLQTVSLEESPFDRRTGMATIRVDTAGGTGAHLEMRYLARDDARELRELLVRRAGETAFVW